MTLTLQLPQHITLQLILTTYHTITHFSFYYTFRNLCL
ncbi:hypothetical protein NP493_438g02135 [Ridgeia piscesae]|uniref:Uncharacterized protein n=1 Tax=Ridgeia piscesae TaxID=27915 RepID=A0AAD9L041_RIDPI|nr:hypothetical protein NP493_438g02135 [Ridgeia piscesae]